MTGILDIETFSNKSPPFSLTDLDANFAAILAAISNPRVSVKDPLFGAVGDGITDDTTAILAARAYVLSLPYPATLWFDPGIYKYTTGIVWPKTLPVSIGGVPGQSWLWQSGGDTNGCIQVQGGVSNTQVGGGATVNGSFALSTGRPGGCIFGLILMSDSGPCLNGVDACQVQLYNVWMPWCNAAYAALDLNGGVAWRGFGVDIGDSDKNYPANVNALIAGHPNSKYNYRSESRAHTTTTEAGTVVTGVTCLAQEHVFVGGRWAQINGTEVVRIVGDAAGHSFGHQLIGMKMDGLMSPNIGINIQNADVVGNGIVLEAVDATARSVQVAGGTTYLNNLLTGGVVQTDVGSYATKLITTGGRIGSLKFATQKISLFQSLLTGYDVDPLTVAASFVGDTLADGPPNVWLGADKCVSVGMKVQAADGVGGYAVRGNASTANTVPTPMFELEQTAGGGVTAAIIRMQLTSAGFPYWYDKTNNKTLFITDGSLIPFQSATAPAVIDNDTITTAGTGVARVAPGAARVGIILQSGTFPGQLVTVVNESAAVNTLTFAIAGTSHVADGAASIIAGLTSRSFAWDSVTALWYPSK